MLGQIHGVVTQATIETKWFEGPVGEDELTAEDLRAARSEIDGHFGTVQAALNTGLYDQSLVGVGFAGAQGQAKVKGFRGAMKRFVSTAGNVLGRLQGALRWSGTIVGSVTAALQKEIEKVPGAAFSVEAIKEYIEVLQNAAESSGGGSKRE
jgi:hypothetical protein